MQRSRAAARGPTKGTQSGSTTAGPLWERRSKEACAVFAVRRKRSLAEFATTMERRKGPSKYVKYRSCANFGSLRISSFHRAETFAGKKF